MSSNTIVDWFNFCRELSHRSLEHSPASQAIGGPGVVVEVDESKFGKRKYHRGHRVDGAWVFGGREKENKKMCFFEVVKDRTASTLLEVIQRKVLPGSVIYSDCWKGYSCLESHGYVHYTVNHSENFKDPVTGVHTNSIEGTWQKIKRGLTFPRFGVKAQHLGSYLGEFQWRCFHSSATDLWQAFLDSIKKVHYGQCEAGDCLFCTSPSRYLVCNEKNCSICRVDESVEEEELADDDLSASVHF
jgi:transposase-like protein